MNYMKLLFLALIISILTACGGEIKTDTDKKMELSNDEKDNTSVLDEKTNIEKIISNKISSMTLEQKVGQLFMCSFRKDSSNQPVTKINDNIINILDKYEIGGVILFGENIDTEEQVKSFISEIKQKSKSEIPLFVGVDEEGGRVSRLHASGKIESAYVPPALEIGKGGDTQKAYDYSLSIAEKLKTLGFNIDFAPVADINTNPDNTVIGDRAYGNEPISTGKMVAKAVEGFKDGGIIPVMKHFPGHGDTISDTHTEETYIGHDIERLSTTEFIPFEMGIEAGAMFIMTAHIKTPNVTDDNLPASLSSEMIDGILREKLNFKGVVITDALDMGAITKYYSSGDAAVRAINAGVDILLMPENFEEAYNAIVDAVNNGTISQDRIDDSLERILSVKYDAEGL